MVAAEYTKFPIVRYFLNMLDCIAVKRDGRDMGATKQAIRHLRDGKAVGIFLEGRIIPPGEVGEPKDGVAMLALKTGTKVIPTHISGTSYRSTMIRSLLARHRVRVRFGPPVDLSGLDSARDGRAAVRAATLRIYEAIKALAPDDDPQWGAPARGREGQTPDRPAEASPPVKPNVSEPNL